MRRLRRIESAMIVSLIRALSLAPPADSFIDAASGILFHYARNSTVMLSTAAATASQVRTPMPIKAKYLFVASMDVDPDKEALFNEVYDTEHVPNLLKVPGVHAATRTMGEPFVFSIGGEQKRVVHEGPRHTAL